MAKKKRKPSPYGPDNDGFTHINILAGKAMTLVGKRLSHFAHSPFIHPYYGAFQSMEGYWHYISTGFCHEELRHLIGLKAKQHAQNLHTRWYDHFCEDVMAGNYQKIIQDRNLSDMIMESELPFKHYYLFPDRSDPTKIVTVTPRESAWLTAGFEEIRAALKNGTVPKSWKAATLRYAQNVANGNPPQGLREQREE